MNELSVKREKLLSDLQSDAFKYFVNEVNPDNGLVVDCTKEGWPSSIAAVGMALSSYPVGVEHNLITREEAIERTLTTLRFFAASEQRTDPDRPGNASCLRSTLHFSSRGCSRPLVISIMILPLRMKSEEWQARSIAELIGV